MVATWTTRLGEEAYAAALAEGRLMTLVQALEMAEGAREGAPSALNKSR